MRVKKEKCDFLKESVEYLGHKITANGIQPTESKVEAVVNAPQPTNKTELNSYATILWKVYTSVIDITISIE